MAISPEIAPTCDVLYPLRIVIVPEGFIITNLTTG